ncbi:MAG: HepT-like ribonuclease domain-containing protein [Cyanobacteria bacterium P01_D01_bin.128]
MLDAASKIEQYVQDETRESLEQDERLALAIVRLIEILGEAASRVSKETQLRQSEIPWKEIIGMRNRIVHAYFDIDYDIVWETAKSNIPSLKSLLESLLKPEDYKLS